MELKSDLNCKKDVNTDVNMLLRPQEGSSASLSVFRIYLTEFNSTLLSSGFKTDSPASYFI